MEESLRALFSAWPFGAFILVVGLCIGSFLNVCIYRLPAGKSIAWPGSHCQSCLAPIAWYDNIPVLSFFLLGGRCRRCGATFSARYMLVELATGLVWFGFWLAYFKLGLRTVGGPSGEIVEPSPGLYLVHMVLASALLVSGVIDYDLKEIYVSVTYVAVGAGVVGAFLWPDLQRLGAYGHELAPRTGWDRTDALVMALVGAAVGSGLINLTRFLGTVAFHKEAMGAGDAYLMAAIGGVLGWEASVLVFFAAPFIGLPFGLWSLWRQTRRQGGEAETEEAEAPSPPRLNYGTFVTAVAGFGLLVAASVQAQGEWGMGARVTLVGSLLAFGASLYLLGREEEPAAEDEAAEPSVPQPAVDDAHEMPYGPSLGMAAGIVMLVQEWPMAWFGPGMDQMWHTLVG
jgi:leader peptidase (prepilin peptidase) / N-methyltransferase